MEIISNVVAQNMNWCTAYVQQLILFWCDSKS